MLLLAQVLSGQAVTGWGSVLCGDGDPTRELLGWADVGHDGLERLAAGGTQKAANAITLKDYRR